MSSLPLVSPAALGRPVDVVATAWPTLVFKRLSAMPKLAGVIPASRLDVRPAPQMVPSGVREIDTLTGGLPRGCLTEICGPASSGRTSVLLAALAAATQRQEVCALVDISDAFNPHSAAAAGVNFEKMLWVRCGGSKQKAGSPPGGRAADSDSCVLGQAVIANLLVHSRTETQRHREEEWKNRKTGRAGIASHRLALAKRRLRVSDYRSRRHFIENGSPHSVDLLVSFSTRGRAHSHCSVRH